MFSFAALWASAQTSPSDWQQQLHDYVKNQQLDAALELVQQRLAEYPTDLEARGWRGRVLAWKGNWEGAEAEYRQVLEQAPNDTDILTALSDVLVWQQKLQEALQTLDRAHELDPRETEILVRRARVLQMLGRNSESQADFRSTLALDPANTVARSGLIGLAGETKHEFRVGEDVDTFNYTDPAQTQSLALLSRWTSRWSTVLGTNFYQRFGQDATKFAASTAFRFTAQDWLNLGSAVADDHGVIPSNEAFFEYGHGFHFRNQWIRGLEGSYQQRWLWYRGAHVLTLNLTQIYYLPKDWTWALTVTGARSGFSGTGIDWAPSGSTRLAFPLYRTLSGNVSFGVGSENFAQVDQIGRFSARTFGGGVRYRFTSNQDIGGYVASQHRSQGRSQNSFGLNYGFRF